MSANEIIAELPELNQQELLKVDCRLHELLQTPKDKSVWEALLEISGTAEGLPVDLAKQHDHYLHGTPKR